MIEFETLTKENNSENLSDALHNFLENDFQINETSNIKNIENNFEFNEDISSMDSLSNEIDLSNNIDNVLDNFDISNEIDQDELSDIPPDDYFDKLTDEDIFEFFDEEFNFEPEKYEQIYN